MLYNDSPDKEKIRNLAAMAEVESRGGEDVKHKPSKGSKAMELYGLMPRTVRDIVDKDEQLNRSYGGLVGMTDDELTKKLRSNPELQELLASKYYDSLKFGDDTEKVAYGWLNGRQGTLDALRDKQDLSNHWHVKKVQKALNDDANLSDSDIGLRALERFMKQY